MPDRYANLSVERDGHVAIVTLNRPSKANALNPAHLEEIEAVALSFRDEPDTRAVIFTGTGKHFSSGTDLTERAVPKPGGMVQRRRDMRIGERAVQAVYDIDQITIAAWNGGALGGGACLVTAMDFRIGADDCFMQYPEIDIGVNLMWKSLPLVTHLAGPARAKQLVAGGARVPAQTLLEWGLLDDLGPRANLLQRARRWADFYAAKPPIPAQMIKRSVNAISSALDAAIMHMDVDQNLLTAMTDDRKAAFEAYMAKQEPVFKGN